MKWINWWEREQERRSDLEENESWNDMEMVWLEQESMQWVKRLSAMIFRLFFTSTIVGNVAMMMMMISFAYNLHWAKWKWACSCFSHQTNIEAFAHLHFSLPQEVMKQEEWTPWVGFSLSLDGLWNCSVQYDAWWCFQCIYPKMMMTSINYNNYYSGRQKANLIRKLFHRNTAVTKLYHIKHDSSCRRHILKFYTDAVGTQTHDNFFICLLCD